MKKIKLKRLAFLITVMSLLFTSGCSLFPVQINVKLTNRSTKEVHMWIQGEVIGPNNKLAPGKSRQAHLIMEEEGVAKPEYTIGVSAGTNGETQFYERFTCFNQSVLKVKFTGSGLVVYQ